MDLRKQTMHKKVKDIYRTLVKKRDMRMVYFVITMPSVPFRNQDYWGTYTAEQYAEKLLTELVDESKYQTNIPSDAGNGSLYYAGIDPACS